MANIVDEILVVTSSKKQEKTYTAALGSRAKIVTDKFQMQSPLVGALTGFEHTSSAYALLLPCDTPFISSAIAAILLERCINQNAAIPQWPNGYIEPLQAAYNTQSSLTAIEKALEEKRKSVRSLINYLEKICYVPTTVLGQADPKLMTFFNVNEPSDLRKAERMLRGIPSTGSYVQLS